MNEKYDLKQLETKIKELQEKLANAERQAEGWRIDSFKYRGLAREAEEKLKAGPKVIFQSNDAEAIFQVKAEAEAKVKAAKDELAKYKKDVQESVNLIVERRMAAKEKELSDLGRWRIL